MSKEFEEWRPVVGYEGWYEVSNFGRLKRVRAGRATKVGYILSLSPSPYGYLRTCLSKDGVSTLHPIHRLVTDAFLGPCPDGLVRNHKDGNKQNNRPSNLEFVTHAENIAHAGRHGLMQRGVDRPMAKLTEAQVREIKPLKGKESMVTVGERYGVTSAAISCIWTGKTWKHILP